MAPIAAAAAAVARAAPCRVEAREPWAQLRLHSDAGWVVLGVDEPDTVRQVAAMAALEPVDVHLVAVRASLYCAVTSASWRYVFWALPVDAGRH